MRAPLAFLLAAMMVFGAGCMPANQLDWKVRAKNPDDYNAWATATITKLEPRLQQEYNRAFNQILSRMPNGGLVKHMQQAYNPACQRIHNRTIRDVIIDGYTIEREKLLLREANQTDMMMRNANNARALDSAKSEARFAQARDYQTEGLERISERLAAIDARLKELAP